jgi:hypothetical protein
MGAGDPEDKPTVNAQQPAERKETMVEKEGEDGKVQNGTDTGGNTGGPSLDSAKLARLAENTVSLLSELIRVMNEHAAKFQDTRTRMLADLQALLAPMPPSNRDHLTSQLSLRVQQVFDQRGSPKVEVTEKCLGAPGFTIRATEGNVSVGVCVTGSLDSGPTGGGIEASFRC